MQVKKDGAMKKTIGSIFFLVHEYLPCALQINKMWEYVTINTWILWVRMYINIYLYTYIVHIHIYIYIVFTYIHIAFTYIHGISWLFLLVDVTVVDSLGINHITQCFIRCCVFRAK